MDKRLEDMTDEELAAIAGVSLNSNMENMSDEELAKIAGVELKKKPDTIQDQIYAGLKGAESTMYGNWADEFKSAVGAPVQYGVGKMLGEKNPYKNMSLSDIYNKNQQRQALERQALEQQYPDTYMGGQVFGALASPINRVAGFKGLLPTGFTPIQGAQKIMQAAGAQGLISGSGEGNNISDRLSNAGEQGALGALTAGALSKAPQAGKWAARQITGVKEGAMDAFNRLGVPATLADIGESAFSKGGQQFLAEVPSASNIIKRGVRATREGLTDVLGGVVPMQASQPEGGRALKSSVKKFIDKGKSGANKLYGVADGMLSSQGINREHLSGLVDDFKQRLMDEGLSDEQVAEAMNSRPMKRVLGLLRESAPVRALPTSTLFGADVPSQASTNGKVLNYGALKKARSIIGNMISDRPIVGAEKTEYADDAYRILTQHMEELARGVGPEAEQAVNSANTFYKNFIDQSKNIFAPLKKKKTGKDAFKFVATKIGDPEYIQPYLSQLSGRELEAARGSLMNKLGLKTNNAATEFDPFEFARNIADPEKADIEALTTGMIPARKKAFLNAVKLAQQTYETGNIPTSIERVIRGGIRYGSIPAVVAGSFAAGGGLLPAVGALAATNFAAKAMTNQKFLNWLSAASKAKPQLYPQLTARLLSIGEEDPEVANIIEQAKPYVEQRNSQIDETIDQSTPDYFTKLKQAESAGNPNAMASTSSASGLFQFTDKTWSDMVKKYGKELDLTHKNKNDPAAQERAVIQFTLDNADYLAKKLKYNPDEGDLYVAHFLGAPKAARMISLKNSKGPASAAFPEAAAANKSIFFDKNRPRSVSEVYQLLRDKVS